MNSFRPLVYLSKGANATRVFHRDCGLVQGDLSPAIARTAQRPFPETAEPVYDKTVSRPQSCRHALFPRVVAHGRCSGAIPEDAVQLMGWSAAFTPQLAERRK